MKKIVLSLFLGVLVGAFVMPVMAQELTQNRKTVTFSPGLMAGRASTTVQNQKAPVKKTLPNSARTTLLRFDVGQIELSEVQKELLFHVAKQLKTSYNRSVSITAASKSNVDALARATRVRSFLELYSETQARFYVRIIQPEHVINSVDNTVKIVITR